MKQKIILTIIFLIFAFLFLVLFDWTAEVGMKQKAEIPDIIVVDFPYIKSEVSSPLKITGQAKGLWFFEASFPVLLKDSKGKVIASGSARAKGDWMTDKMVPFEAVLDFKSVNEKDGFLVLKKDNPSGLLENERELSFPISF